MARKINMITLFVVLAATLLQSTFAATYTVGDTAGWRVPTTNSDDFYDDWAQNKTFLVGDTLVFNFVTGQHDVAQVTEAAYENCNGANAISTSNNGPASIRLNTTGDHYFICTIGSHCTSGQKLKVEVQNGTTPSAPTPGSSPNTPTGGSTPPPPPPSSASSLVATLSLVFVSIVLVLSCY